MEAKNESVRITERVVRANLDCSQKSFLLMFHRDLSKPTEYGQMIEERRRNVATSYLSRHKHKGTLSLVGTPDEDPWAVGDISTNQIFSKGFATENVLFEVVGNRGRIDQPSISPVIFSSSSTLRMEDKTELAFAGHVLQLTLNTPTLSGKIVLISGQEKTLKISDAATSFRPSLTLFNGWLNSSRDPPLIALNKHCGECEFKEHCRPIAEKEDSLSLLSKIGPAELTRYGKKGIFTIKQLSFLYRPRKRNRRGKTISVKHLFELQALALRTGNIYLHGEATLIPSALPEIYLDIEALPDAKFNYLIGIIVSSHEGVERFQYWANSIDEEVAIFTKLVALLNCYPTSPIFHYGNFEKLAIVNMGRDYETPIDKILSRLFNVNTCIFGKTYFPVKSNGFKDICRYLGLTWTASEASGSQSIVWRYRYDMTHDETFRDLLLLRN